MTIFYDLIFCMYFLLYVPYLCFKRKWHRGFGMRLGIFSLAMKENLRANESIWIHAVSVGEVTVMLPLINRLLKAYPHVKILCSTVTKTGYAVASQQLVGKATVIYAPLDASWIVRRVIRLARPQIYIAVETEIWPNLFTALSRHHVPIVQINGRISDQAFARYQQIRWLLRPVLKKVARFCMQTEEDAKRIQALGADAAKVQVLGNLKFDNVPTDDPLASLLQSGDEGIQYLIAGSTHPGEEEILLKSYLVLREAFPKLRLVVAPRHVERSPEVVRLIREYQCEPLLLSKFQQSSFTAQHVLVVDTIGQLRALYQQATLVFIGKTLMVGGGQNMIEPAFFGKCILVGPLTANFRDVVSVMLAAKALVRVSDAQELEKQLYYYLENSGERQQIGAVAREVVQSHQGATERTFQEIVEVLVRSRS